MNLAHLLVPIAAACKESDCHNIDWYLVMISPPNAMGFLEAATWECWALDKWAASNVLAFHLWLLL